MSHTMMRRNFVFDFALIEEEYFFGWAFSLVGLLRKNFFEAMVMNMEQLNCTVIHIQRIQIEMH